MLTNVFKHKCTYIIYKYIHAHRHTLNIIYISFEGMYVYVFMYVSSLNKIASTAE